jgi:1,4-dihydroxy-2-naphthoate octaprenyltransferase
LTNSKSISKKIYTVPVLIGEKAARYIILAMMVASYLITGYLIAIRFFTPIMAIVLLAIPTFLQTYPALLKPKPDTRPADFPEGQGGWPLYFAPYAFRNNRSFGSLFMVGLLLDVALRLLPATSVSGDDILVLNVIPLQIWDLKRGRRGQIIAAR